MLKFLAPVVFGGLGLLFSAGDAFAAGGCAGCAAAAPSCGTAATRAEMQMSQATRSTRSFSYEPGAVRTYQPSYRSYGRRPSTGGFSDATAKGRGNY